MRLIDADALIVEIKTCLWDWESVNGIMAKTVLNQTITDVGNMPTIDAVPVVRCKDCKHGDKENGQYYCHYTGETWNDGNFYCAGGERKDDE